MPNWVFNSLTVEGSPEDIKAIKEQLNKPFSKFYDNWNSDTGQMEVKEYFFDAPVFAFHNIFNHIDDGVSDEDYLKQPNHNLNEPITFSGNSWYDWNVRNWGTKWDVAVSNDDKYPDTELMDESETSLAYRFNTAWSPPTDAIAKLSEQYPNAVFDLDYEEEQGWGGNTVFSEGNASEVESYDNKCRDCDAIDSLEYCDTCEIDVCLECKNLDEADPEAVKECEEHNGL